MNTVEAKSKKLRREDMERLGMELAGSPDIPVRRRRSNEDKQSKQLQEQPNRPHQMDSPPRPRKPKKKSSSKKKKKHSSHHASHNKHASSKERLTASAKDVVQQKWRTKRWEAHIRSLATAPQQQDSEDSVSDDDTDATPRMKATRESSSESERGLYDDDDSSLSSLNNDKEHREEKKHPSNTSGEHHPPTDLEFALGMESAERKLKRIAKDQEEAVIRKKVDYDNLRDLLGAYAKDPKNADHDRLNQLLAAMGESIPEINASFSEDLAPEDGSSKDNHSEEQPSEPTESLLHASDAVDDIAVGEYLQGNTSGSAEPSPGASSEKDEYTGEKRGAADKQGVDALKRDILKACGVKDVAEFVSVPRKSAMPRRGSLDRKSSEQRKVNDKSISPSTPPESTSYPESTSAETKERHQDKDSGSPHGNQGSTDELKQDILTAYGVEEHVEFVSVQRKSAMPRKGAVANGRLDSLSSSTPPGSNISSYPETKSIENEGRSPSSNHGNQATDGLKRDILEACGVEDVDEFVSVPRKSAMPRKGMVEPSATEPKPRAPQSTPTSSSSLPERDSFQEGPLSSKDGSGKQWSAKEEVTMNNQASSELKRDILEACGVEDVEFVSVQRKSAMPRRGVVGDGLADSKPRAFASEQISSAHPVRNNAYQGSNDNTRRENPGLRTAASMDGATHITPPTALPDHAEHNKQETIQLLMADGDGVKVEEFVVVPLKPPTLSMRTGKPKARPTKGTTSMLAAAGESRSAEASSPPTTTAEMHSEESQIKPVPPKPAAAPTTAEQVEETSRSKSKSPPRRNRRALRHKKELNDALCPDEFLEVNRKPHPSRAPEEQDKAEPGKRPAAPKREFKQEEPHTDDYKKDILESLCPDQFLAVSLKPPPTRRSSATALLDEDSLNAADTAGAALVTSHSEDSRVESSAQTEVTDRSTNNSNNNDEQKAPTRPFKLGRLIKGRRARKKANK